MIFITAGTTKFPFKRLDHLVILLSKKYPKEKIIYQNSNILLKLPFKIVTRKFINPVNFQRYLKESKIIISHAGFATTLEAIKYSYVKPILIPRLKSYSEHINNHQEYFARYMESKGLVRVLNDFSDVNFDKNNKRNTTMVEKYLLRLNKKKNNLIRYLNKLTLN